MKKIILSFIGILLSITMLLGCGEKTDIGTEAKSILVKYGYTDVDKTKLGEDTIIMPFKYFGKLDFEEANVVIFMNGDKLANITLSFKLDTKKDISDKRKMVNDVTKELYNKFIGEDYNEHENEIDTEIDNYIKNGPRNYSGGDFGKEKFSVSVSDEDSSTLILITLVNK